MAAPNTSEVRMPQATLSGIGEATDSVQISWSLPASSAAGGFPSVKYSLHTPQGKKVISPTAAELIQKIADIQTQLFQDPEKKEVNVDDGALTNFKFVGFDAGAHHEVSVGRINSGASLVHPCSKLSKLNTSIYAGLPKSVKVDTVSESTTIPGALKEVLKKLMEYFEESIDTSPNLTSDQIGLNKNIHQVNKALVNEFWHPVLDATENVTFDGFDQFMKAPQNREKLVEVVEAVYISSAEDFFIKIDQLSTMFQMMFVPAYSDMAKKVGKFISYKDIIKGAKDKDINVVGISMQCGNKGFYPTNAVIMKGTPTVSVKSANTSSSYEASIVGWPDNIQETDFVSFISVPPWITTELEEPKNLVTRLQATLDPSVYEAAVEQLKAEIEGRVSAVYKVCKDFCRTYYGFTSLSSSSASVSTLLDLSWEPGLRYSVTQEGGEKLFDGFLRAVEHRISSSANGTSASTQLIFDWVEASGFVLPNK